MATAAVPTPASAAAPSALRAVREYLSAASWRDRLPMVLDAARMEPRMEAHYAGQKGPPPAIEILSREEPVPSEAGWVKVDVSVDGTPMVFHLRKVCGRYLLDWESSCAFNPVSPGQFRASRPTAPVRFRVWARLDYYYNHEFIAIRHQAWSIFLCAADGTRLGNGFVANYTDEGRALFETLKDGQAHAVVVDVQYLPRARSASCFLISRVVSLDGWRIEESQAPAGEATAAGQRLSRPAAPAAPALGTHTRGARVPASPVVRAASR